MFKVIVAQSEDPDSQSAIAEILQHCHTDLAGLMPQAGLLFAGIEHDHALVLQQICQTFPDIELIGCTTDGELSSQLGFQQDSLVLTLFCSDQIQIRAGVGRELGRDAIAAAQAALQQVQLDQPARLCLALPDGTTFNGERGLRALQTLLGEEFPIFGGMAADAAAFTCSKQFYKTEVLQDAMPILLLAGDALRFSYGVAAGWQPISTAGRVTKVAPNLVHEIDHKPALEFYRQNTGGLDPSPEHPVAVFNANQSDFFLRAFVKFDEDTGTIHCFADVPLDAKVQVSTASRSDILTASKLSAQQALESYPGSQPAAAIVFTCNCRRRMLGSRIAEEYQIIQACLPTGTACSGFYTYGELSPLREGGPTQVHHITVVTLLLGTQ
jgi:hypothetical protein